jgi:hypothetical protein
MEICLEKSAKKSKNVSVEMERVPKERGRRDPD